MRIIGGAWRRRVLRFAGAPDLRPTPDRVRETLFNWLGQDLHALSCLDLFAGSGALGFEAASRGAGAVVMVEQDARAFGALCENVRLLAAHQVQPLRDDAFGFLHRDGRRFDLVFLDPPYRLGVLPQVLDLLPPHLLPGARVYLESDRVPPIPDGFRSLRGARAGQVEYVLLQWRGDENTNQPGGLSGNL